MREPTVLEERAPSLTSDLQRAPVVPAVRGVGDSLGGILAADYPAVFVLGGGVFELVELLRECVRRPPVFVNVDLARGVSPDAEGIRYLARHVEGVISTHHRTIELARSNGLITIQRLFAIDSGAVERGLKVIARAAPDFVEILPALAYPEIADQYREACGIPVLAGGLVKDAGQVSSLISAGVSGVSTSAERLWGYRGDE